MLKRKSPRFLTHIYLGVAGIIAISAWMIFQPFQRFTPDTKPLADEASLSRLALGQLLPEPPPQELSGTFHGSAVTVPKRGTLASTDTILGADSTVLGAASTKRIEVDLTHQKVYAYESNIKVYEFVVSTGKWGRTPTGVFTIWAKVKSQLMSGGSRQLHTYYYLPNVPWVMFFYNKDITKMRGFSFHGTYWHDNFGHPMSHGCINMKTEEAKLLYEWATPIVTNDKAWSTLSDDENQGTTVVIYGDAPKE